VPEERTRLAVADCLVRNQDDEDGGCNRERGERRHVVGERPEDEQRDEGDGASVADRPGDPVTEEHVGQQVRAKAGAEKLPAATQQLRERARMFFASLPSNGDGRQPFDNREEFLETSGDLYLSLRTTLRLLESEMDLLTDIDDGTRSTTSDLQHAVS